jgi:hypothetical protein
MEMAPDCENDMSNRSNKTDESVGVPRPKIVRKRQPVIVILLVTLFVSLAVMSVILTIPIAWIGKLAEHQTSKGAVS